MCPAQWFEWERVIIGSSSHCCGLSCVTPHPPWAPSQAGSTSLKWEPPTTLRAGTQANNLPRSKLSSWPRDSSASNSTFRPCCAAVGQGQLFRLVGAPLLFINKWRFKHWDSIEQRGQNKAAYRKVFIGQRAKFLEHHLTLPRGNTVASGCPMDMHLPSRTFSLQQAQRTSWGLTQMLWKKGAPWGIPPVSSSVKCLPSTHRLARAEMATDAALETSPLLAVQPCERKQIWPLSMSSHVCQ